MRGGGTDFSSRPTPQHAGETRASQICNNAQNSYCSYPVPGTVLRGGAYYSIELSQQRRKGKHREIKFSASLNSCFISLRNTYFIRGSLESGQREGLSGHAFPRRRKARAARGRRESENVRKCKVTHYVWLWRHGRSLGRRSASRAAGRLRCELAVCSGDPAGDRFVLHRLS